jgi:type VI secretion system protein ImpF
MRDPKHFEGARALLFERLVDLEPERRGVEDEPFRVHSVRALRESVRRELEQLLNTRCSVPLRPTSGAERSVIDYGLPDFSSLSAASGDDQNLLQELIRSTVSFFEPRLRGVTVAVEQLPRHDRSLAVTIGGLLVVGDVLEPVSFPVHLRGAAGVVVHEAETA